jgi:hypothetical protein
MTDRPILFSAPMVRALLDGRKTQTRRLIKLKTGDTFDEKALLGAIQERRPLFDNVAGNVVGTISVVIRCPYGVPGDRLWVKETWAKCDDQGGYVRYYATDDVHELRRKRPSIHMPRWASRLWLTVTDVRVQRLREISEADCKAEGWPGPTPSSSDDPEVHRDAARDWYMDLWGDINGPQSWASNPWVWAVSFTVHRGNIGLKEAA